MVCHGPDPPEDAHAFTAPPSHALPNAGEVTDDSDEEMPSAYDGYEPLPQGPDHIAPSMSSDDETEEQDVSVNTIPNVNVPPIEPIETTLERGVWQIPRQTDPIQMDKEQAEQVMSAMANFMLPASSIPDWAKSISEDQWKEQLKQKIEILKNKR